MSQATQHSPTPALSAGDRQRKYTSPPPLPASMTPPPTSSTHPVPPYPARTPTPTNSHLSSPPPTVKTIKTAAARQRTAKLRDVESNSQSSDNESLHSVDQLRSMLAKAQEECSAAKTSAAHFRFQLELLNFESSEYMKRMEVELEMTSREVDVLQQAKDQPRTASTEDGLVWKNRCIWLENENARLRTDLRNAKSLLLDRDDRNSEETDQLKKRIHDNRLRMNQLRTSGALFGEALPSSYHTSRLDHTYTSPSKMRKDDPFGNLLLADQVLRSQEAASTPSTPLGSRQRNFQARGHNALASLPSTPYRAAPRAHASAYYSKPLAHSPIRREQASSHRDNRHPRSRDSTISASEGEDDDADRIPDSEGSTEVEDEAQYTHGASRASQEAASMLRNSSSFRQSQGRVAQSPPSKAAESAARPSSGGQMYGYQITKAGAPGQAESIKRRFYDEGLGDEGGAKPKKKGRVSRYAVDGENSGLGLGLGL